MARLFFGSPFRRARNLSTMDDRYFVQVAGKEIQVGGMGWYNVRNVKKPVWVSLDRPKAKSTR